jgi:hypothetical protein
MRTSLLDMDLSYEYNMDGLWSDRAFGLLVIIFRLILSMEKH